MTDLPNVYEGMANVIAALSHIPKQRSAGVSYEFRGIDAVMQALHGPLSDNGLFLAPRILDDWRVQMIAGTKDREQTQAVFRVEVEIYASDGTSVVIGPGLAQSHDYGDKAVYQAQQNAIKYLLLEAFCIPVDEPDMDGRTPDPVPAADPTVRFEEICDEWGIVDRDGLLAAYGDDVPRAVAALSKRTTAAAATEKFGGDV